MPWWRITRARDRIMQPRHQMPDSDAAHVAGRSHLLLPRQQKRHVAERIAGSEWRWPERFRFVGVLPIGSSVQYLAQCFGRNLIFDRAVDPVLGSSEGSFLFLLPCPCRTDVAMPHRDNGCGCRWPLDLLLPSRGVFVVTTPPPATAHSWKKAGSRMMSVFHDTNSDDVLS